MLGLAFAVLNVSLISPGPGPSGTIDSRKTSDIVVDRTLGQSVDQSDFWRQHKCHMGCVTGPEDISFQGQVADRLNHGPGLVTAGACNLCIASSLAEFLSAYPT